jgi:hypothetical protein
MNYDNGIILYSICEATSWESSRNCLEVIACIDTDQVLYIGFLPQFKSCTARDATPLDWIRSVVDPMPSRDLVV